MVFRKIHGASFTPEYECWHGMKSRCYNPKHPKFPLYGGRGIKVCDRWLYGENGKTGFKCFLEDIGLRPSPKHSIDRYPDNDGDYTPDNTRWATPAQQKWNSRGCRRMGKSTKTALTATFVRNARPAAARKDIPDGACPGLYLSIEPTGSKRWALRYRRPDGSGRLKRSARLVLGSVHNGVTDDTPPVIGGHLTLAAARHLVAALRHDAAIDQYNRKNRTK
jgi:hypothetical protein